MALNPKGARITLGLNQQKMAYAMGVHRQTWVKWERDERSPGAAALQMMSALLWLHKNGQLDDFLDAHIIIV